MDRQRIGKPACPAEYPPQLLKAIGSYLPRRGLELIGQDKRVRWTDRLLTVMAILTSWQQAATMLDAFEWARAVLVSMYKTRRRPGKTLAGYLAALQNASCRLLGKVVAHLRTCTRRVAGRAWRWKHWAVLAVDGTRVDCPRTCANEEAFGCAGRKKTGPQQYLSTVFHVCTGLIWDFRRGSGTASERDHLRGMTYGLPHRSLLLMDAGYSGYDLLSSLVAAGHDFIVRVGSNVALLRKLGYYVKEHDGIVYLWPESQRKREPLVLRCVRVKSSRQSVVLLTSVLDETRLTDAEVAAWYRRRWQAELSYRSLKQTLGKRKMLSDTPDRARVELDWTVVSLWLLGLATAEQQRQPSSGPYGVVSWSAAKALRAVRRAMHHRHARAPAGGLRRQLRLARIDGYRRKGSRKARDWPHKKNQPPRGLPKFRTATRMEVRLAKGLVLCYS